jgi:hypothetical protein
MVSVTVYITYLKCIHQETIVEKRKERKSLISKVKKYVTTPFDDKIAYESKCVSDYCPACKADPNIEKPSYNRSMSLPGMKKTHPPAPHCLHTDDEIYVASNESPDPSDINTEYVYDVDRRHTEIAQRQGWADSYVRAMPQPPESSHAPGTAQRTSGERNIASNQEGPKTGGEIRRKAVPSPASPSGHGRVSNFSRPKPTLGRSMSDTHWQSHHHTPQKPVNLNSENIAEGGLPDHRTDDSLAGKGKQRDPETPRRLPAVRFA